MFFPYADENPAPQSRGPVLGLIAANTVVFFLFHEPADFQRLGLLPGDLSPLRWFSSMFLHGGLAHLLGNAWALWLFGDNVAHRLGRFFVPFYVAGGLMAGVFYWSLGPRGVPMIGASGAIAAVIGAYVALFPRARMRCFKLSLLGGGFVVFSCSALLFSVLYFVSQYVFTRPGIAYSAHIGGFLFGALAGLLLSMQPEDEGAVSAQRSPSDSRSAAEIAAAVAEGRDESAVEAYIAATHADPRGRGAARGGDAAGDGRQRRRRRERRRGLRAAFAGKLRDSCVFSDAGSLEQYLWWEAQLGRLKREPLYA